MVNPNLDAGYPVLFGITGAGGHAIVCDGYGYNPSTMYHHLNMGWSGNDDAWYNLPTIDTAMALIYTIHYMHLQRLYHRFRGDHHRPGDGHQRQSRERGHGDRHAGHAIPPPPTPTASTPWSRCPPAPPSPSAPLRRVYVHSPDGDNGHRHNNTINTRQSLGGGFCRRQLDL